MKKKKKRHRKERGKKNYKKIKWGRGGIEQGREMKLLPLEKEEEIKECKPAVPHLAGLILPPRWLILHCLAFQILCLLFCGVVVSCCFSRCLEAGLPCCSI